MKRLKFILLFFFLLIKRGIFFKTIFNGVDKGCYSNSDNWFYLLCIIDFEYFTMPIVVDKVFKNGFDDWNKFDDEWSEILDKHGVN